MPEREGNAAPALTVIDDLARPRLRVVRPPSRAEAARDWDGPHADRFPAMRGSELVLLPPDALAEREARVLAHQARVAREEAALRAVLAATRAAGKALRVPKLSPEGRARKARRDAATAGLREARHWTACHWCGKLFRQPNVRGTPQKTCSRKCPARPSNRKGAS